MSIGTRILTVTRDGYNGMHGTIVELRTGGAYVDIGDGDRPLWFTFEEMRNA